MNHRLVSGVIAVVVMLFGMAALAFALGVRPGPGAPAGPLPVPHGRSGTHAVCQHCHAAGGGAAPLPSTHRQFPPATCGTCHPGAG